MAPRVSKCAASHNAHMMLSSDKIPDKYKLIVAQ